MNGSFDVDNSSGTLSMSVNGNGILDAANELGVLARLLNYPEPFRSDIRTTQISRAVALAAWQANLIQLDADIGTLASVLNSIAPGLNQVLVGFITLGDGSFTITSAPTTEEPDLPIIVSGHGSFGLVAALFATLNFMLAQELGTGFANPNLRLEDYVTLPELLANQDADGDGFSNQQEYDYFATEDCPVIYGKATKENSPDIAYATAALNYRICPTCENYCAECTPPHSGFYAVGDDACLKVPGMFSTETPFDWSKENSGPLFGDRYEGVDCQTLRIFNLTESDSGVYVCTYGTTASTYSLSITVSTSLPLYSVKTIAGVVVLLLLGAGFIFRYARFVPEET